MNGRRDFDYESGKSIEGSKRSPNLLIYLINSER